MGTTKSLLYQKTCWNLGWEGGREGEAGTMTSCASQECLVRPGWELYDWTLNHRRRRCTSLACSHIQTSSPPLRRKLLHPQLAHHGRYQVQFLSQHSSYPGTATYTNLLLSYCTMLQTKAAARQAHADYCCSHIFSAPSTRAKRTSEVSAACTTNSCGCVRSTQAGTDLIDRNSNFSELLFDFRSMEGYHWIASYPKHMWQGK